MYLSSKIRIKKGNTIGKLDYDDQVKALIKKITQTNYLLSSNNVFIYSPCKLGGLFITTGYDYKCRGSRSEHCSMITK